MILAISEVVDGFVLRIFNGRHEVSRVATTERAFSALRTALKHNGLIFVRLELDTAAL